MWGYTLVALERWVEAVTALEGALKADLKPLNDEARRDVAENLEKALSHGSCVPNEAGASSSMVVKENRFRSPTGFCLGRASFTVEAPGFL